VRAAALLLLAACATRNDRLLADLETRSRDRAAPPAAATPLRPARLPLGPDARPVVPGAVNGVPARLLLDTGSSVVVLSGRLAARAGLWLAPGGALEAIAPGRPLALRRGVAERIEFGGLRFDGAEVFVARREPPWGVDAVIGCSILSRFRATFDFRRREVRLSPHGLAATPEPLFTVAKVAGRERLLMLDSGALGLFLEPWAMRGVAGRTTVELLGVRCEEVPVRKIDTFPGEDAKHAGLLGFPSLGAHAWTIDFASRTLALE